MATTALWYGFSMWIGTVAALTTNYAAITLLEAGACMCGLAAYFASCASLWYAAQQFRQLCDDDG